MKSEYAARAAGEPPMGRRGTNTKGRAVVPLHVGDVNFSDAGADECAVVADRVARIVTDSDSGIGQLRVRVTEVASVGLAVGQVNLTRAGWPLRIQAAGTRPRHAGMLLVERLARHLHQGGVRFRPRPWPDPMAGPSPGQGGGSPAIARRKRVRLETLTAEAAMAELDARDLLAHLYIDADTGADAVIHRGGPYGYRLTRPVSGANPVHRQGVLVTSPRPVPELTESEAMARAAVGSDPFLFFTRPDGRGALLYARYAGGYGLVTAR